MKSDCVAATHPSLAGHFPGHPVVPAAVILTRVIAAARTRYPGMTVTGVRKAKFMQPLPPDRPFDIDLRHPAAGRLDFSCLLAGGVVVQGRLAVEPDAH